MTRVQKIRVRRGPRGAQKDVENIDARWAEMEAGIQPAPTRFWPVRLPHTDEHFSDVRVYNADGQLLRTIPKAELVKLPHMPKDWVGNVETWAARKHQKGKYAVLSPEQHGPELRIDAFRD